MKTKQFTPENITELKENEIFVFGSNGAGNHIGGAAKLASDKFGAIIGQARGMQGKSYAIETLDRDMNKVGLAEIKFSLFELVAYATKNPSKTFLVTKIGCGIAGYLESEIASIFKSINFPVNVVLPIEFCVTKGYKVFNSDWTCRGMKYEVGKTYSEDIDLQACNIGFHFCERLVDCYDYYSYDCSNKIAEVECLGITHTDDGKKIATNSIMIVREIQWGDVDILVNIGVGNIGRGNSGYRNSGDRNSGYRNSGDRNSGDQNSGCRNSGYLNSGYRNSGCRNSGDLNSGDLNSGYQNSGYQNSGDQNSGDQNSGCRNSGDLNSGDRNSGCRNSGYQNSGYRNSGCRNSGDLNSGYRNSGIFCTKQREDTIIIFDSPCNMTWDEWYDSNVFELTRSLVITEWICWGSMSEFERSANKQAYICDGYLKTYSYKEAWLNLWGTFSEEEKAGFKKLPNWNVDKFEFITGIRYE